MDSRYWILLKYRRRTLRKHQNFPSCSPAPLRIRLRSLPSCPDSQRLDRTLIIGSVHQRIVNYNDFIFGDLIFQQLFHTANFIGQSIQTAELQFRAICQKIRIVLRSLKSMCVTPVSSFSPIAPARERSAASLFVSFCVNTSPYSASGKAQPYTSGRDTSAGALSETAIIRPPAEME